MLDALMLIAISHENVCREEFLCEPRNDSDNPSRRADLWIPCPSSLWCKRNWFTLDAYPASNGKLKGFQDHVPRHGSRRVAGIRDQAPCFPVAALRVQDLMQLLVLTHMASLKRGTGTEFPDPLAELVLKAPERGRDSLRDTVHR